MKTKKVAFHPILPDVLCCETLKGDVLIIQISDNSFSGFSCHIRDSDIKKLQGRKPFSIGWNVRNKIPLHLYPPLKLPIYCFTGKWD